MVRLLGRGISPTQVNYLHRATQHRKTRTHLHACSEILTHDPNVRTVEDRTALNRAATGTDKPRALFGMD